MKLRHEQMKICAFISWVFYIVVFFVNLRWKFYGTKEHYLDSLFDEFFRHPINPKHVLQLNEKLVQNWKSYQRAFYYRPQTKFAKVMFLHLSVSHSVHKGEYLGRYPPGRYTPQAGTPPRQVPNSQVPPSAGTPPGQVHHPGHSVCWDTVNKQAVSIPLECTFVIWVYHDICNSARSAYVGKIRLLKRTHSR